MRLHRLPFPIHNDHQRVLDLLKTVALHLDSPIILRIAGGWVRNSLLNISCNDFDVAIETVSPDQSTVVTGVAFAKALMDYQKNVGLESRTVGIIKKNPQKSKHIEAASTHIHGIAVDFLHLRREEYENSRIPIISRGNIQEDALRRDFTVNALYYNLHTQLVEDYVGGIEDLSKKVLRCPLDPYVTFLDDPLRLLRAVRFAAQFDLTIDVKIIEASKKSEIQRALCEKVSRERVGKELIASLEKSTALQTFCLLKNLKCLESVFRYAESTANIKDFNFALETTPFVWGSREQKLIHVLLNQMDREYMEPHNQPVCFFAALFAYRLQHGEQMDRIRSCAVDSLKLSKKTVDRVIRTLRATTSFFAFLQKILVARDLGSVEAIKKELVDVCHPNVQPKIAACFDSSIYSARIHLFSIFRSLEGIGHTPALLNAVHLYVHHLERYHPERVIGISPALLFTIFQRVLQEDESSLFTCHTWKPVVRGDDILKILSIEKPAIKHALACVLYLQVEIPGVTRERAVLLLKQNESALKSVRKEDYNRILSCLNSSGVSTCQ